MPRHSRKPKLDPLTELKQFSVDPQAVRLLSLAYCREKRVVVLGKVDPAARTPVNVGMLDPDNKLMLRHIEERLGRPVSAVRLNSFEIERALDIAEGKSVEEAEFRLTLRAAAGDAFDPDASVVNILNWVLANAVHLRASDIHIETYEDDVDVRLRLDGLLQHINTPLSRANIAAAISRLKILAGLDITERRRAQDGRILADFAGDGQRRKIDFRLSVVPGPCGEDAVLRILDSTKPLIGLDALGLSQETGAQLEELIRNPEGLFLVTGPTGSGKTTTLYAALQRVRLADKKILTVEDPIEYSFDKVNQKQVGPAMGFADYARSFMRQNPDIIMIGEIRDEATAEAAVRAAQTGHLVLSTLHTSDAVRTVSRLATLGVDANLIAGTLLGSLSQRLARRVCIHCREEVAPNERERKLFDVAARQARYFRGRGCDACGGSGYHGRIGLYELFVADEELAEMITAEAPSHELRRRARAKGMRSLLDDALDKARSGLTSLAEILRVVPYRIIATERS